MRSPGRRPAAVGSADTRERGQESAEGRPEGREGGLGGREAQRPREFKGRGRKNLRDSGVQRRTLKAAAGREAVEKHSCRAPRPAPRARLPAPRARLPAPGQHWLLRAHGRHGDTNPERQMGTTPSRCAARLEFCGIPMS